MELVFSIGLIYINYLIDFPLLQIPNLKNLLQSRLVLGWGKRSFQYFEPKSGANFDDTRTYRYSLSRVWDPQKEKIVFIGLNPSTADEKEDDQTLKRCLDYAKRWSNGKYGSLEMVNLFAYCSTEYEQLKYVLDPIGQQNDQYILETVRNASLVVVAWGENGRYLKRDKAVLNLLSKANISVYCLDILKGGQPKHPLYAKKNLNPIIFDFTVMK